MQINTDKKDYIHNNFRTFAPLNWMLKLIGLGCNLPGDKTPNRYWTIAKTVVTVSAFGAIDFYTLHYKLNYLADALSPSIKYTDVVQVMYDFTQYLVDLFYIRKYGNAICCEYFRQYEAIDQIIGAVNYSMTRKKLLTLTILFSVLWTLSSVCDFVAWVLSYDWVNALIFSTSYAFLLIKILTTLDLTSHIMHIECRLLALGDLMQNYFDGIEYSSPLFQRNTKKWLDCSVRYTVTEPRNSNTRRRESHVNYHEIQWLSRCYMLLTEQTTFINKMYGIRILLNSLSLLIDMVRFTNIAARILAGTQKTRYFSGYTPVISSIMRMLTCAAVLVSLARHCELVYRQRERLLDIIDNLLVYKKPSEDLKSAAIELRSLIQARPIDFTMANFFRMDFSLLVSIASVVVTYSIILLQNIN